MTTPSSHSRLTRRQVLYRGRVQGVGFRYTTRHIAQQFSVTGYVRNLPDGRVELVVEADRDECDRFLLAVQDAMAGHITHSEPQEQTPTAEFSQFEVRP